MIAKYREMGSRDKKGKLKYYVVTQNHDKNKFKCDCIGFTYRPYQDCKHIKRLKTKLRIV